MRTATGAAYVSVPLAVRGIVDECCDESQEGRVPAATAVSLLVAINPRRLLSERGLQVGPKSGWRTPTNAGWERRSPAGEPAMADGYFTEVRVIG